MAADAELEFSYPDYTFVRDQTDTGFILSECLPMMKDKMESEL